MTEIRFSPACDACLRESVLRSEALRYAERTFSRTIDAAALLRLETDALHRRLTELFPDVEGAMARSMTKLLDSVDEAFGGAWTICKHDAGYPERLMALEDTPPVLYGIGTQALIADLADESDGIAIVGARRASAYGREVAYSLAQEASGLGLVVVSGMALGVDGAAHRGALQAGGRTIAVLAGGPDVAYPRSHRLLHEQIASTGCVVSENPPGVQAKRWAFVARNRIIAGLASISVFVEGSIDSGARHTMDFADQIGSAVGAVPGPVTSPLSAGPNALLSRDEAVVVRDIADVIEVLAIEMERPPVDICATPAVEGLLAEVLELVAAGDGTPRTIAQSLEGVGMREIVRALGQLELSRLVRRRADGSYEPVTQ